MDDGSSDASENGEDGDALDPEDPDARDEQKYTKQVLYASVPVMLLTSTTRPVSFVSGSTKQEESAGNQTGDDGDESSGVAANDLDPSPETQGASSMEDEEEEEGEAGDSPMPVLGSPSFSASHFTAPVVTSSAAPHAEGNAVDSTPGPSRGGIGARGGIGSSSASRGLNSSNTSFANMNMFSAQDTSLPTSFGSPNAANTPPTNRGQRSFVRDPRSATDSQKPVASLTAEDHRQFQKLSGSFGAKLMAKMGWTPVRPSECGPYCLSSNCTASL